MLAALISAATACGASKAHHFDLTFSVSLFDSVRCTGCREKICSNDSSQVRIFCIYGFELSRNLIRAISYRRSTHDRSMRNRLRERRQETGLDAPWFHKGD